MAVTTVHHEPGLMDISAAPDIYADRLAKIEVLGPVTRLTFAVPQSGHDGHPELHAVVKVLIRSDALSAVARQLDSAVLGGTLPQATALGVMAARH